MGTRKTVGVKELKNKLSAYLREVRQGTHVLVSDRDTVVAELHQPGAVYVVDREPHPRISAWARTGVVTLPTRPKTPMPRSPVRLPKGTSARLLEETRGDR